MKTITIATYNIHHGHDVGLDFARLADVITESHAEIIGIQEVDQMTNRVGGRDTLAELSAATGLSHTYFTPAMDYDGGRYGTAILSQYPIREAESHELYSGGFEPRSVGIAVVILPDGTALRVVNTHLSVESADARAIQMKQIAYRCGEMLDNRIPTVIMGDFNTQIMDDLSPFGEYGFVTVNGTSERYPTFWPNGVAIDHILFQRERVNPVSAFMLDRDTSDHFLLACTFTIL